MPMKLLLNTFLLLFCSVSLFAQGENNVWAFGDGMVLDFNDTDTPKLSSSSMVSVEGCASISDESGRLLFYSNGNLVWDRNNNIMPNSIGLLGNTGTSSYQGVAIVPFYGDKNRFYLFVTEANEHINEDFEPGYLRYSVIDLTLNSGFGDVVPSLKNIIIDSMVGEMLTEIKGDGCFTWLLVHRIDTAIFHAFKIGSSELEVSPVISTSGKVIADPIYGGRPYSQAMMRGSPDGKFIANMARNDDNYVFELHKFNSKSGKVSEGFIFSDKCWGGLEFSGDSKFLYTSETDGLFQYKTPLINDTAKFKSSSLLISTEFTDFISSFRMGVDRKIYILDRDYKLSRIISPNKEGILCDFQKNLIQLPRSSFYLGTPVVVPNLIERYSRLIDSTNCRSNEIEIIADKNWNNHLWSTGEKTPSIKVSKSSTVWVATTVDACRVAIDTFKVVLPKVFSKLRDTVVCNDNFVSLDAQTDDAIYKWQDGSTSATFTTNQAGKYWVNVITPECNVTDTIIVNDGNFIFDLGENRSVCAEEEFKLQPNIVGNYLWQDGSDAKIYTVKETGHYHLKVRRGGCFSADSIFISKVKCNNCLLLPNVFTPNNDSKNDVFRPMISCPVLNYTFKIVNRYGQLVFESSNPSAFWDGKFKNQDAEVGVYYYFIEAVFDKPNSTKEFFKGDMSLIR